MITSRNQLYDTFYSDEQSKYIQGFIREDIKDFLDTSIKKTVAVPIEFDCRPDLIANYFLGSPELFWVLVYVNQIDNSPEGFSSGTTIQIPDINKLRDKL